MVLKFINIFKVSLVAVATIGLVTAVSVVKAQQGSGDGFKISPVKEELVLNKGEVKKLKIYVTNTTNNEVSAKAEAYNGGATGEDGNFGIDLDNKNQYSNNFKSLVAPIPAFKLAPSGQPGDKKDLDVVLTIPNNANPGAYIGAIRILPEKNQSDGQQVNITGSVATIYLINVAGSVKEDANLVSFSAANYVSPTNVKTGKLLISPKKVALVTKIKDTGNTYIKPYGKVRVYKGSKLINEYEFNDKNVNPVSILPGQTRKFVDELKIDDLGTGKYSAVAELSYGNGGNIITAKTSFVIMPTWMIVTIAVALVAIVFGIVYTFARRKKGKSRSSSHKRR